MLFHGHMGAPQCAAPVRQEELILNVNLNGGFVPNRTLVGQYSKG
jgi:hypothetical protein